MTPQPLFRALAAVPLILGLAHLGFATGCVAPSDPTVGLPLTASQAYVSYDETWSLTYPLGWKVVPFEGRPAGTTFGATSPEQDELYVAAQQLDTEAPGLDALMDQARREHADALLEVGLVYLNGHSAVKVVANAAVDDRPVRVLRYLIPDGKRLYELLMRTRPEAFESRQADLESIATSFKPR